MSSAKNSLTLSVIDGQHMDEVINGKDVCQPAYTGYRKCIQAGCFDLYTCTRLQVLIIKLNQILRLTNL